MSYLEYQLELVQQQICVYKWNTAQVRSDHLVTMADHLVTMELSYSNTCDCIDWCCLLLAKPFRQKDSRCVYKEPLS